MLLIRIREHRPQFVPLLIRNVANLGFNCLAALAILRINVNWYGKLERGVFSGVSCSGSNGTRLELVDQSQSLVLQIFGAMASLGYWLALTVGSWAEADLPRGSAFFLPTALLLTVAAPLCLFSPRLATRSLACPPRRLRSLRLSPCYPLPA